MSSLTPLLPFCLRSKCKIHIPQDSANLSMSSCPPTRTPRFSRTAWTMEVSSTISSQRALLPTGRLSSTRLTSRSFGFSTECLGQHSGDNQAANLGDGNGTRTRLILHHLPFLIFRSAVNQTAVIRWDYGNVQLGTCEETIEGGNHFRYWIQNGPDADSGAIFMATSYEMPLSGTSLAPVWHDSSPSLNCWSRST